MLPATASSRSRHRVESCVSNPGPVIEWRHSAAAAFEQCNSGRRGDLQTRSRLYRCHGPSCCSARSGRSGNGAPSTSSCAWARGQGTSAPAPARPGGYRVPLESQRHLQCGSWTLRDRARSGPAPTGLRFRSSNWLARGGVAALARRPDPGSASCHGRLRRAQHARPAPPAIRGDRRRRRGRLPGHIRFPREVADLARRRVFGGIAFRVA